MIGPTDHISFLTSSQEVDYQVISLIGLICSGIIIIIIIIIIIVIIIIDIVIIIINIRSWKLVTTGALCADHTSSVICLD